MDDPHSTVIVHNCDKFVIQTFTGALRSSLPVSDVLERSQTILCLDTVPELLTFVDNHFKHREDVLSSAVAKPLNDSRVNESVCDRSYQLLITCNTNIISA